ncbi:MAG: Fe-S-binding domain-containing protein, partial [Caldilineaceae bacterium]|nr:Fe-S-binding domain-containing protein [Caldilineaceae bacterium]
VALDMILFFLFFEATLIPMYFLIAEWGGQNRMYAALKFFLYTLAGSATLLIAILAVYFTAGTADIVDLQGVQLPLGLQTWAFFAFAIGLG